ncbi:AAA family ATPase [Shewanella gelidimarina]|uniref:UvrD-helicase domain-containing protein n=1 Tax=Shewanella gelidimarina TaxID=56813 RepID=UPI00200EB6F8|nr:UvrD-helicase domain-containing protein [Shewanella gelidimarina]MCL1056475.1 AAA family ATPase [Shewanella gelidimarina]
MRVEAVLDTERGAIVAPAGCGKTHLITETLSVKNTKPILVLTHTTAGVSALKKRLRKLSVPTSHYVVTTIDGWALRIANSFPVTCPIHSSPETPRLFYPEIRQSVLRLLITGSISDILRASYSRLLVDEYQDCDVNQHNLITSLSEVLPTVIFGDPMQCIFNFGGPMPDWDNGVLQHFPLIEELDTPWRWNNVGAPALGEWILAARETLKQGARVDLRTCPAHITLHPLTDIAQSDLTNQHNAQHTILNQHPTDSLLVIGSSVCDRSRHNYAQSNSRIEVVEPVQLASVTNAASQFDDNTGLALSTTIMQVASTMMTHVEMAKTSQRVDSILNGRSRTAVTNSEQALCNVVIDSSRSNILEALQLLELKTGTRVYRKGAYNALKDSLSLAVTSPTVSMFEAASSIRERLRQQGDKRIPSRAIGSTLLLKGLEADHCMILDAQARGMNANHLYVALSRGAKTVTIFSRDVYIP